MVREDDSGPPASWNERLRPQVFSQSKEPYEILRFPMVARGTIKRTKILEVSWFLQVLAGKNTHRESYVPLQLKQIKATKPFVLLN